MLVLQNKASAWEVRSRPGASAGPCAHCGVEVAAMPGEWCLRGLPRRRLRATTAPPWNSSPPQTPHGSPRSSAPARQQPRWEQEAHSLFAHSISPASSEKNSPACGPTHVGWPDPETACRCA